MESGVASKPDNAPRPSRRTDRSVASFMVVRILSASSAFFAISNSLVYDGDMMINRLGFVLLITACQTLTGSDQPPSALLRADSAEVGVQYSGFAYSAKIGYTYTNTTSRPVSRAGCGGPPPPDLEKNVAGHWVRAYSPVSLLCLTKPDFMVPSGVTIHDTLQFWAAEPGRNTEPSLLVDSIDGVYRLRWDMVEGTDATRQGARIVTSTSNEFFRVLTKP